MRLEVKTGQHGCTLINDSYNSDIHSLDIALDFMARRPDHKGRRRTLILSDIFEWTHPAQLYREVGLCLERGVGEVHHRSVCPAGRPKGWREVLLQFSRQVHRQ